MRGDHLRTQLLIQRTFPAPKECFLVMPLHQMFSLQVRQTRPAAFVGVFGGSAMLWVISTSGCYTFVFQQPIGIGLEIRLARGPDFQRMTKGTPGDEVGKIRFE